MLLFMTFRVLHTSDWHLGQYFYGKSRANEHQQFLSWLLKEVEDKHIDAVIVAGDIFDTGTPPSYAREMYFNFIVAMHQLNCTLVILAGNHDSVAMLGESTSVLSALSCHVITTANNESKEQLITLKNPDGTLQAVICAIPFIRPRDIVLSQAGQSPKEKQQALQKAITTHYQTLYEHAKLLANENVPIIATGHLTALGVTTSESVRDIYIGTLEAFPSNAFPPADYIALGHIHRSQKVGKKDHIRYSGSPIPLSFDEINQPKSVLLVEFEHASLKQVSEITIPCFQPMAMIKSNLDDLTEDVEACVNGLEKSERDIWLDIEIESAAYLGDLTQKITKITEDFPVEVLLTRKAKSLKPNNKTIEKVTLEELNVTDVFTSRLNEEDWSAEGEDSRKSRLNSLFLDILSQVEHGHSNEEELPENDPSIVKAEKSAPLEQNIVDVQREAES